MSTVMVTTGSEGPAHDRYGYTEVRVARTGRPVVVAHMGLTIWLMAGHRKYEFIGPEKEALKALEIGFEAEAGVTIGVATRAYRRVKSRCPCGCREFKYVSGYPGETFQVCDRCGKVIDTDFDVKAVE